jgi:hypothetical protein
VLCVSGVSNMLCKHFSIGVLFAVLAAAPVSAAKIEGKAQLNSINGKVLVNQGTGFLKPSSGMSLKIGDKIFVGHEASAVITYVADKCQVQVPANRVVAIEVLSPCQNKAVQIHPAADLPIPPEAQAYVPPRFPWEVVGLVVIGGGACILLCDFDDDDKPDSPGDGNNQD